MKKLIAELETFAMNSELEINAKKTFILTTNPKPEQFQINNATIEQVTQLKYLGSQMMLTLNADALLAMWLKLN